MEAQVSPESALASLEFPAILELLVAGTRTPYGSDRARVLRATPSLAEARRMQAATREMRLHRQSQGALPLSLVADARPLLQRLEIEGSVLTGQEINGILETVRVSQEVRSLLSRASAPGLRQFGREFPDLGNLLRYLQGKISATGELEDRCSGELLRIRRQISSLTERLVRALRDIASRAEVARALQDDFVALRSNRHVLPVRIDSQGCVEGIVHALSSSGATVYVEPLSTVPLNNDLVRLKEQEEVEIRRILLDFTDLLRSRRGDLRQSIGALGEADLLSAKAVLAEEMRGVEPELHGEVSHPEEPCLLLDGARHPVLERSLRGSGRPLVPLDLRMEARHRVLVVSGPNTGGKTVTLKTVGLLALMAQCGLQLPALSARLPTFRKILIDIGDHQSIPESLSTFSARLASINEMARELEDPALILLDEVGSGTDPEEGGSLGAAIIEFFRKRKALVLATTHHQGIKAYAAITSGVGNASVEFDEGSFQPLYRLRAGIPGRSGGLDIAERLGLPEEIVRFARGILPRQRQILEEYLKSLQGLQEELERRIRETGEQIREARRREGELEAAARRLSLDRESRFAQYLEEATALMERRWNAYLETVQDREERSRLRREFQRRQRELLGTVREGLAPDLGPPSRPPRESPPASLRPGDRVRVVALNVEGLVERLEGDQAVVRSGGKQLRVPVSELETATAGSPSGRIQRGGVRLTRPSDRSVRGEINLVGKRVDEALDLLDKYLDDVYLAALTPVRVIHGVGTGKLGAAIRRFLERHPHVEGFAAAEEREGGRGATVVRIRG